MNAKSASYTLRLLMLCVVWSAFSPVVDAQSDSDASQPTSRSLAECHLNATFTQSQTLSGTIRLVPEFSEQIKEPLVIGRTNLEDLQLSCEGRALSVAADSDGNLLPLTSTGLSEMTGTWMRTGVTSGRATTFLLQLPPALTCEIVLQTPTGVGVSSPDALVISDSSKEGMTAWKVFPNRTSEVTLRLSGHTSPAQTSSMQTASVSQDVRLDSHRVFVQWNVTVSRLERPATMELRCSAPCHITRVTVDDKSPSLVHAISDDEVPTVTLTLSAGPRRTFRIRALADVQKKGQHDVPLLLPVTASEGEWGFTLEAATLRIAVPPSLFVVGHDLTGVYEQDINWAADGTLTLDLIQFDQNASVRIRTTPTRAEVEDSVLVLMRPQSRTDTAIAYVSLAVKTGQVGRVEWSLPVSWRVTSISELSTGAPVLFQSAAVPVDDRLDFEARLRSPVSAGESHALRIELQSAVIASGTSDAPDLISRTFRRRGDFVATNDSRVSPGETITAAEASLAWVPADDISAVKLFRRRRSFSFSAAARPAASDLFYTVDYGVTRDDVEIEEVIRLSLSSPDGLPEVVRFRTTAPGLRIAGDGDAAPELSLSPVGEQTGYWQLSLNSAAGRREVVVPLIARRRFQQQIQASTISVEQARFTGGSIQPPAAATGFAIELPEDSEQVTEIVPYPDPAEGSLLLRRDRSGRGPQRVAGTVFQLVREREQAGFESEYLARLYVDVVSDPAKLSLRIIGVEDIDTFVNGVPCHPQRAGGRIVIPLNPDLPRNIVDIHFFSQSATRTHVHLTGLDCAGELPASVHRTVVLPAGFRPSETPPDGNMFVQSPALAHERFSDLYESVEHSPLSAVVADFQSRWGIAARAAESALTVSNSTNTIAISVEPAGWNVFITLLYATVFCLVWLVFRRNFQRSSRVAVGGLILTSAFRLSQPDILANPLSGLIVCIVFLSTGTLVRQATDRRNVPRRVRSAVQSLATGLMLISVMHPVSADESDRTWISADQAWVVNCDVELTLESPRSALAVITCELAVDRQTECRLPMPLDGLTLVDCTIDGKAVLPRRSAGGGAELVIPVDREDEAEDKPATRVRRTAVYRIRTAPQWSRGRGAVKVLHPAAPVTRLTLLDVMQTVIKARYRDTNAAGQSVAPGQWTFPQRFGSQVLDVEVERDVAEATEPTAADSAAIVQCEAEVSPGQLRLTNTYELKSDPGVPNDVRIGYESAYRITSVENAEGEPLSYSQEKGFIRTLAPPDTDGLQTVRIRMLREVPMGLQQSLPVGRLQIVDGVKTERVGMTVRTTDRFVVAQIIQEVSENGKTDEVSVESGSDFLVQRGVDQVRVMIEPRELNREVQIRQICTVEEEHVAWACDCRMEISGQPLYRQSISIPPEVRVSDVVAETGGVSRIRRWTRDDHGLVVALREATRGVLDIRVKGDLLRLQDSDTRLPQVTLRDAQILESSIKLAAAPDVEAWIKDLGSTVSDTAIDITRESLPAAALRLTVEDETRPVIIRARPRRQVVADVAVLVYEFGDQPLISQFVFVEMPVARFAPQFRLRDDGFPAVNPAAFRRNSPIPIVPEGEDYRVPKPARDEQANTVLVLPHLIPPDSAQMVSVSVPQINADMRVRSHRVFDLRQSARARAAATALPDWIRTPAQDSDVIENDVDGVEVRHDYRDDGQRLRFRIRQNDAAPVPATQAVAAVGTHLLKGCGEPCVSGTSDLMVFCREENPLIRLVLPPQIDVTDIRVNGLRRLPGEGDVIEVRGTDAINHVSIKWLHPNPGGATEIPLPDVANTLSDHTAIIKRPDDVYLRWNVDGQAMSRSEHLRKQAVALRKGLRVLTGSQPSATGPGVTTGDSPDAEFWELVRTEAPDAAQSFTAAIEAQTQLLGQNCVIADAEARTVKFTRVNFPEPLPLAALVVGCVALVWPRVRQGRLRLRSVSTQQASTVITGSHDDVESTVIAEQSE